MGGGSGKKWIFIYFITVFFQYFIVRINSAGICYQYNCTTNCCNCTTEPAQLCNNSRCPLGFYLSDEDCDCMYMSTTVSPSENDTDSTSSRNSMTTINITISSHSSTLTTETTTTAKTNFVCRKCNEACLSCEVSANNCTACHKDFILDKGGKCKAADTSALEKQLPIIIGASVGGGVVLIAAIITIVCCIHRRNIGDTSRGNTSRMSEILQGRTEAGEKPDDITELHSPYPIYQNVEWSNTLGSEIQEHGDTVLRYARDPTKMDKKREPVPPDPSRSSSYYQNSSTIRRQDNIQDTSVEHAEIKQLGTAPPPPSGPKKKSRKSLKSHLSKKIKRLTGNANPEKSNEAQEEHYVPMGPRTSQPDSPANNETSEENQEVYEPMEDHHQPQENYENVRDTSDDVPSVQAPPLPSEQEDYENIKGKFTIQERVKTGQKSKARMPDPATEAKRSQTSQESGDNKEDYMNVEKYRRYEPKSSKKDDLTSQVAQEEMEDYENLKYSSKKK